jgi:hypothetical protein
MDIEGLGAYEEVDILGFDSGEKVFYLFSLTNTSATHDHEGKWLDESRINFLYDGMQDGKRYREEIDVLILNEREFAIHEKDVLDGQIVSMMDITLTK